MKIKKLHLVNFTQFTDLTIELFSGVTIFIGNNGTGKTSLLRAVTILLSWLVAQINQGNAHGNSISELDINMEARFSRLSLEGDDLSIVDNSAPFQWTLVKQRQGFKPAHRYELGNLSHLAAVYRNRLCQNQNSSLPLMVYYPIERAILDLPRRIRTHPGFTQLDGYENALIQGVDFRRFFEWFCQCEEAKNKTVMQAVGNAITTFIPSVTQIQLQRKPRRRMMVEKHGKIFEIAQLSQGEKSLIALIGDLARRLTIMNPSLKNLLYGNGIVLIDEIDLHLHPQWQHNFILHLRNTFPNCQFLLTTHSPMMISEAKNVQYYFLDNMQY